MLRTPIKSFSTFSEAMLSTHRLKSQMSLRMSSSLSGTLVHSFASTMYLLILSKYKSKSLPGLEGSGVVM